MIWLLTSLQLCPKSLAGVSSPDLTTTLSKVVLSPKDTVALATTFLQHQSYILHDQTLCPTTLKQKEVKESDGHDDDVCSYKITRPFILVTTLVPMCTVGPSNHTMYVPMYYIP